MPKSCAPSGWACCRQKLANDLRNAGFALPAALYDADTLADDLAALYQAHQEGSHA